MYACLLVIEIDRKWLTVKEGRHINTELQEDASKYIKIKTCNG